MDERERRKPWIGNIVEKRIISLEYLGEKDGEQPDRYVSSQRKSLFNNMALLFLASLRPRNERHVRFFQRLSTEVWYH